MSASGLWGWWRPRPPVAMPADPDDSLLTQPEAVRRRLRALGPGAAPVWIQPVDDPGRAGPARLEIAVDGLRLHGAPSGPGRALNVAAPSDGGLLLFTLACATRAGDGAWRAPWPGAVLHTQSRRHFRVRWPRCGDEPVRLSCVARPDGVVLLDLSESGAAFALDREPSDALPAPARLLLGAEGLPVPSLEFVHVGPGRGGAGWRVGARFHGLDGADLRRLRLVLDRAQRAALHPAADPAAAPA